MTFTVSPELSTLFGSETRVRVLASLADSEEPLTGYRIAKMSGVQEIKAYRELQRLARAGLVKEVRERRAGSGWQLSDPELRRFLQRKIRVTWYEAIARKTLQLERESRTVLAEYEKDPIVLSRFTPEPSKAPSLKEFDRPREKDRILARLGLPTSTRRR